MEIIVGIGIVVVLSLIVASALGGEGGDQENRFSEPLRYIDEEELAELEEGRRWEELPRGPEPAAPNYFDRLMTPGSEESLGTTPPWTRAMTRRTGEGGGMGMAGIGDFCGVYRKVLLATSFFLENKKEAVASFLHFVYLHSREM